MPQRTILFELNELPWRVLDDHVRRKPKSALARLVARSRSYVSVTEEPGELSPWRTWPSLHRGVASDRHCLLDFGQPLEEIDREHPPLWTILERHGVRAGVFGSLHARVPASAGEASRFAFMVPDTLAAGSECFPEQLRPFQELCAGMARESARNVCSRLPWGGALRLLADAPGLGLRASTIARGARQLVAERVSPSRLARRRTLHGMLAFDLFFRQLDTARPDFASFFTNHVAATMHRYWAAAHPGDYACNGFSPEWIGAFRGEIDFAMDAADRMAARLVAFVEAHAGWRLVVASSMGQAPTVATPVETQLYLLDLPRFTAALGLPSGSWTRVPAMAPQVNLRIAAPAVASFRRALDEIRIEGQPIGRREADGGFFSLDFGQADVHRGPQAAELRGRSVPFDDLGLRCVRIQDESSTTAYHVPEGVLLVFDPKGPRPGAGRPQVSILDVAPFLLAGYGVATAPAMRRTTSL